MKRRIRVSTSQKMTFTSLALLLGALAVSFEWIPGLPHTPLKVATLSSVPHPEMQGVSVYLQAPAVVQVQGVAELLSVQVVSHSNKPQIFLAPSLYSDHCFDFSPLPTAEGREQPFPITLQPHQSVMMLYQLSALPGPSTCKGQHALILYYSWQEPLEMAPGTFIYQQSAISTTPLEIIGATAPRWRQLFHIASLLAAAILIPVLLALLNFTYQNAQAAREKRQKLQAYKLEIWKAIYPGILTLIQQHYLPIVRRVDSTCDTLKTLLTGTGECPPPTPLQTEELLHRLILFRAQVRKLMSTFGGYHFRSKPGEELCGQLAELFWFTLLPYQQQQQYEEFATLVDLLFSRKSPIGDTVKLTTQPQMAAQDIVRNSLERHLRAFPRRKLYEAMSYSLALLSALLNFECDRPLLEWYEKPPIFPMKEFQENAKHLTESPLLEKHKEKLLHCIADYVEDIPKRCYRT